MSRPKQSSELEALSDSLHEQDHRPSDGPMSESVSLQGPHGQPVHEEELLSLHKLQKQINIQHTSIDTLTQAIERLANSKYTQSRTKSKPASKRKRNCSSQSSATSSSSAEVSSSESESGWRYKRPKIESKPSSRRNEGNTGPSDPEVASNPIRNRGLMKVAQRPDIPCKTSAVVHLTQMLSTV